MKPPSLLLPRPNPTGMSVPTSSSPVVLGIDPGGKTCGMVLRQGRTVTRAVLVINSDAPALSRDYLAEVIDAAEDAYEWGSYFDPPGTRRLVAIEDVVHPNPHLGLANMDGLLHTAQVLGALRVRFPDAILVRPGGHGSAPLASYPPELVGDKEIKGTGKLRHARSAYDIAGAAVVQLRTGSA